MSEHSRDVLNIDSLTTSVNRRTVADIEREIVDWSKRKATDERDFDKQTIAAWRLDLKKFLQVFEVRPMTFICPLLTSRFQTELTIETCAIAPDISHGVSNPSAITSNIQCKVLTSRKDVDDHNRAASVPHTMTVTE